MRGGTDKMLALAAVQAEVTGRDDDRVTVGRSGVEASALDPAALFRIPNAKACG